MHVIDGSNNELHTVLRGTNKVIANFGRQGHYAGEFHMGHAIAMNSEGNLYIGEVGEGKRVQKFVHLEQVNNQ